MEPSKESGAAITTFAVEKVRHGPERGQTWLALRASRLTRCTPSWFQACTQAPLSLHPALQFAGEVCLRCMLGGQSRLDPGDASSIGLLAEAAAGLRLVDEHAREELARHLLRHGLDSRSVFLGWTVKDVPGLASECRSPCSPGARPPPTSVPAAARLGPFCSMLQPTALSFDHHMGAIPSSSPTHTAVRSFQTSWAGRRRLPPSSCSSSPTATIRSYAIS